MSDGPERDDGVYHIALPRVQLSLFFIPLSVDSLVGVSQVLAMCGLPVPQINPFPVLVPLQGRPLREQQEVATAVIQRCYRKYKQVIL